MTKERPILFSTPMVLAILDGRKTQTRRVVLKGRYADADYELRELLQGRGRAIFEANRPAKRNELLMPCFGSNCPYGIVGDKLWVRETFAEHPEIPKTAIYRANWKDLGSAPFKWRPSIFMPRWASRITLEIAGVRVERLNSISDADAEGEGLASEWSDDQGESPGMYVYYSHATPKMKGFASPTAAFFELWESINGRGSWDRNPWVWVVSFKKL